MTGKGSLFGSIIDRISKSMGGGGSSTDDGNVGNNDGSGAGNDFLVDPDEPASIEAADIIKALTDEVEELKIGQQEMLKSIKELTEQVKSDGEFKKSIGEGLIALMENTEKIAASPAARRGATSVTETGIQKGNLGGASARKHRQLTVTDRDELADVITRAVQDNELDIHDAGKLETQINKSIRDPNFQIEPRLLVFLEKKLAKTA